MRVPSLVAAVALVGIAILPAASLGAQQSRENAFSWSKQLAPGSTLTIKNVNGPIDVEASSGDRVTVRAEKVSVNGRDNPADYTFDVQEHGGDVSICTAYRGQSACSGDTDWRNTHMSIEYTVEIPSTTKLHVTTGNGAIDVTHAGTLVTASTGNGRVTIGATEGQVTASSGNGDVSVEGAKGPVKVSTGNGHVSIRTSDGPVTATTGNGNVDVEMTAVHGDDEMNFTSGSGAIRVTLPANFAGRIDAQTGNGSVTSDFEMTISGRLDTHHLRGSIGGGSGPLIKMGTGNGRIEIRKR